MNQILKIVATGLLLVILGAQTAMLGKINNTQKQGSEQLASIATAQNSPTPKEIQDQINANGYQAVFLTNQQVYFGKLKEINANFFSLTDIYYLKDPSGGDTSLVKLGNELHGPKDYMYIPKGQVLFIENLKDSSQVVQAIHKYKP